MAVLRGLVYELLHGERREVLVRRLDDRTHALYGRADPRPHDRHLGDQRVADPVRPELGEHPLRHAHQAAHLDDVLRLVFVLVAAHRLGHGVAQGLAVGRLRHRRS